MTTTGAAGWHRDPTGRHEQRYFDGQRWTEHVATGGQVAVDPVPSPVSQPTPMHTPASASMAYGAVPTAVPVPTARRRDGGSIAAAVAAGVVMLAAFMPWGRVWFVSVSGTDGGDGWITLVLAAVGLVLSLTTLTGNTQPIAHVATIIVGFVAGAVGFVDLADIMGTDGAEVGMGLWLTVAGAIAMIVGGAVSIANRDRR